MALLTKKQILNSRDSDTKIVDMTKEWGGEVKVKALSLKELAEYEAMRESGENHDLVSKLVMLSCVDEDNNRLFDESDIEALNNKDTNAMVKIFKIATSLNVVSDNSIETEAKN